MRILAVEPLDGFEVRLTLTDGTQKTVDLERLLRGPVFDEIRHDPAIFRSVKVDRRAGTIVWPSGADIDPDVLCRDLDPAWVSDTGGQD